MSIFSEWREQAKRSRELYPPGTRIELLGMDDPFAPIEPGTRGTVRMVDDAGQLHMQWDDGRTLAVVPGEDSFRKLTDEEIAEENGTQESNENMDEDGNIPTIRIELDSRLSPAANAQRYYKLYTKSKTTKEKSVQMLSDLEVEQVYLENVLYSIERADSLKDLEEIKKELGIPSACTQQDSKENQIYKII